MKGEHQLDEVGERNLNDSEPLLEKQVESSPGSSGEIKDEEIEAASAACCRICLEYDAEPGEELISPCMCKGTQQFVHRSCLDHWRSVKEGFAFSHCTTCKAQFHLRVEFLEDYSWRKIKFPIFVARDVLLVFLAVQTAIATIGSFAYFMDKNGSFRNSFRYGWDRILSKHPIPFYYCLGVIVFFVLLGFFGLILHCSSFNNHDPCMGVPQLLLWVGYSRLFPSFHGGVLCSGSHLCDCLCHPRHCLWFPCSNHGYPKDMAKTLPHKEGAHKGVCGRGPPWVLHPTKAGP